MIRNFLVTLLFIVPFLCVGQVSDMIAVKKSNGRLIKLFTEGSKITLETNYYKFTSGTITSVKNDSVYIKTYDIRVYMTNLGVTRADTFRTMIDGYYYKDIASVKVYEKQRFVRGKIDKLLILGGGGYALLNIINTAYLKQPFNDPKNVRRLGCAGIAIAAGLIIRKWFYVNRNSDKKDIIEYISMKRSAS